MRIIRHVHTSGSRGIALALVVLLAACASVATRDARQSLAAAELAFARDGLDLGVRAAFIAHFAPDGLVFEPAPVRVREIWPTRPAVADPRAVRLEWRPMLVDVARAGDLGISTGPFHVVDTTGRGPERWGAFFSVWQRQGDGAWKVWLDMGAGSDVPVPNSAWGAAPRPRTGPQDADAPTATAVSERDRALSGVGGTDFVRQLAIDGRRYREGAPPLVGAAWQDALLAEAGSVDYVPSEARVSASGDLAASYGQITRHAIDGAATTGYYVHVWVRDGGAWWLAVESVVGGD
jgi:ketosteroid isomerase-like protein